MSEWQPIETAPRIRDRPILGYITAGGWYYAREVVVKWQSELIGWSMPGISGLKVDYWMPLPAPPTQVQHSGAQND